MYLIRHYRPGEEMQLWDLFYHTIRQVNRQDYSLEQVQAWAPDAMDARQWRLRIERINPYVCVSGDLIVGYADLQESGYIDHFFVHHQWQSRGVGKQLFSRIESEARRLRLVELTANVSITAREFFESRGFQVVAAQEVTLGSVVLNNFRMIKRLSRQD